FVAVAYHVQRGCDNRLEIRRKDRRQGARRRPYRPFLGPAGVKIMKKRTVILLAGAVGIAAAAGFITRSSWMGGSSNAQGPQRPRMVSVELAKAERKSMPVDVDAIGMVTPISSVALK